MIVYFANRKMEIVGQASTSLPKGYTIIEDLKTEEIETGVSSFECKIEFDDKSRLAVEEMTDAGNYILRSNGDENEFYTIIETEIDTKEHYIYIYAEDAGLDLLNEIVGEYEATESQTAEWYINKYINDSGFEIGINEIPSTSVRKLKWDGEATCTERLASIANEFGGYEISYSYQISNMIITNKYVNIYKKRGKDVGIQLRLNRDIDRIITKKSVANLATAFRCTGGTPENSNTPITLKGYSYDDGDFYVGTDGVLRSRKACEKWSRYVWNKEPNQLSGYKGNIIRLYSYDTTSQATLCSHAITELKKICDMEVNYEVDIKKLPDNVKIGDRVNIVDDVGKLYLSTRILQLETSVTEQSQTATLGEYLIKNDGISQKVTELAEQFAQRAEAQKKVEDDLIIVKATVDTANTNASDALTEATNASTTASSANETANYVRENYVDIAMTKIDNAWVQSLIVKGNLIAQDITADEGTFYKLTGVRVYGDVIQANSIKADSLILKNSEDGLYYRLNVDSLGKVTADSDPKYQEGIDGSVIVAESITASKIKVDELLASKILAQDITATGTITGVTLKGTTLDVEDSISILASGTNIGYISGWINNVNDKRINIEASYAGLKLSSWCNSNYDDTSYIDISCEDSYANTKSNINLLPTSISVETYSIDTTVNKININDEGISISTNKLNITTKDDTSDSLKIYSNSIAFGSGCQLASALYLGAGTDSDGTRFYINNNGTGRFNTLFENGTALSDKYASSSHASHNSILSNGSIGYSGTTISFYKKWSDSSNHDMITATNSYTAVGYGSATTYLRGSSYKLGSTSGTTITSDINLKKDFTELYDKYDKFYDELKPKLYKYIHGTSDRYHCGFITQEVENALSNSELTTQEFGGVNIMDIDRQIELDENGNEVDIKNSGNNYLLDKGITKEHDLIYSEFIALNTWQIQKLKTKVKEQQNEIEILKQRLENVEQKVGGNSAS